MDLYAQNIYDRWVHVIEKCKNNIKIFTPYLDNTLYLLLEKSLDKDLDISIYTYFFFDEDQVGNKAKLICLIRLSKLNVNIFMLDYLHAKCLIVDDIHVVLGSQNFTNQGKLNREISAYKKTSKTSRFYCSIQNWINKAENISTEDLQVLLDNVESSKDFIKQIMQIKYRSDIIFSFFGTARKRSSSKSGYEIYIDYQKYSDELKGKGIINKGMFYSVYFMEKNEFYFARLNNTSCSRFTKGFDVKMYRDFKPHKISLSVELRRYSEENGNVRCTFFVDLDEENKERVYVINLIYDGLSDFSLVKEQIISQNSEQIEFIRNKLFDESGDIKSKYFNRIFRQFRFSKPVLWSESFNDWNIKPGKCGLSIAKVQDAYLLLIEDI